MSDSDFKLDAFIEEGGRRVPFSLSVSAPCKDQDGVAYYCEIRAPKLFRNPKKIYGADETQARELSAGFVLSFLQGRRLLDKDGQVLNLDSKSFFC